MYLITVAVAAEDGHTGPLPMSDLARALQVSPVSANQMVRKLSERGLLAYHPYHGVELTPEGAAVAGRVLRVRRLWATFLAGHLGLTPGAADRQACRLEHVTSAEIADLLAGFLGRPTTGPLGRRIPAAERDAAPEPAPLLLADLEVGAGAEVVAVEAEPGVRTFLAASGVAPGARITVTGRGADAGVLVETTAGPIHLARSAAESVRVIGESG